jgi:hypothetical protein
LLDRADAERLENPVMLEQLTGGNDETENRH